MLPNDSYGQSVSESYVNGPLRYIVILLFMYKKKSI